MGVQDERSDVQEELFLAVVLLNEPYRFIAAQRGAVAGFLQHLRQGVLVRQAGRTCGLGR